MQNLKEISEKIFMVASDILATNKSVEPKYFLIKDGAVLPLPAFFDNEPMKEATIHAIWEVCKKIDADAIILASEAWMVLTDNIDIDCPPSKHPDKVEMLSVTYMNKDGTDGGMVRANIERDENDNPSVSELKYIEDSDTIGGRMFMPWGNVGTKH